ncbi:MAG: ATP-binding protein [Minwuia sp.]|nr:ATP-binding protein [Minwuia sp.]
MDIDRQHLESDRKRLFQCLLNLLSNAAKFTENGEIALRVLSRIVNGQAMIEFQVRDTGIGLTPEQLDKVFEPFEQADGTLTREREGTGLGLTITRRIVQMMGGDISAVSTLGEGSTFTLSVPAELAQEHDEGLIRSGEPVPVIAASGVASVDADGGGPLAVVIDDDQDALDIYRRVLERSGYRTRMATDGDAGLAVIRALLPDLVVLDIAMPGMDGWDVMAALKAEPELAEIPVVVASVNDQAERGLALGAVDWLIKPVSAEALTETAARLRRNTGFPRVLVFSDQIDVIEPVSDTLDDMGITCLFFESPDHLPDLQTFGPDVLMIDLNSCFGNPDVLDRLKAQSQWSEMRVVLLAAPADTGHELRPSIDPRLPPEDLLREIEKFVTPARKAVVAAA